VLSCHLKQSLRCFLWRSDLLQLPFDCLAFKSQGKEKEEIQLCSFTAQPDLIGQSIKKKRGSTPRLGTEHVCPRASRASLAWQLSLALIFFPCRNSVPIRSLARASSGLCTSQSEPRVPADQHARSQLGFLVGRPIWPHAVKRTLAARLGAISWSLDPRRCLRSSELIARPALVALLFSF
jgi:hypothetical protein